MIRPAYPDELSRAQSRLEGHPVPAHATYLLYLKETPVERIIAAIPSWKAPGQNKDAPDTLRFHLTSLDRINLETLEELLSALEDLARAQGLPSLTFDIPLPENHPLYTALLKQGYQISQTDRSFTGPGDSVKSRALQIHQELNSEIPPTWKIESIQGHQPERLFAFVAAQGLMSAQAFQNYWNTANREHFQADYSYLLLDGGDILGLLLVTLRGKKELHIHIEAVDPKHREQSSLISASLRNASFSHCPDDFPEIFTWRTDSQIHHQSGTEAPPRHFLNKPLS